METIHRWECHRTRSLRICAMRSRRCERDRSRARRATHRWWTKATCDPSTERWCDPWIGEHQWWSWSSRRRTSPRPWRSILLAPADLFVETVTRYTGYLVRDDDTWNRWHPWQAACQMVFDCCCCWNLKSSLFAWTWLVYCAQTHTHWDLAWIVYRYILSSSSRA